VLWFLYFHIFIFPFRVTAEGEVEQKKKKKDEEKDKKVKKGRVTKLSDVSDDDADGGGWEAVKGGIAVVVSQCSALVAVLQSHVTWHVMSYHNVMKFWLFANPEMLGFWQPNPRIFGILVYSNVLLYSPVSMR